MSVAIYIYIYNPEKPVLNNQNSVQEKLRSGEEVVAGDAWPLFLYPDNAYDEDDPWKGLLRSPLLVKVNSDCHSLHCISPSVFEPRAEHIEGL